MGNPVIYHDHRAYVLYDTVELRTGESVGIALRRAECEGIVKVYPHNSLNGTAKNNEE